MLAAEFENFEILKRTIDGFIDNGLITDWFLYCDNAMRISPPLNISDAELDLVEQIVLN
jgi:4-aminobutyrate aminotransferase-like enzyme